MGRSHRPKLGQHFLTDARIQRRIVDSIPLAPKDLAIEIGPGKGALTTLSAKRAEQVVAIELDPFLAKQLQKTFSGNRCVEIVEGDILSADLSEICRRHRRESCFILGNLPYYITSPILRHLFRFHGLIRGMTLLVQQEVAERITAAPGSRTYGYLSALAQLFSKPRMVFVIGRGAFSPPPKVQSALVDFAMKPLAAGSAELEALLSFLKLCFGKKRKTLVNNLEVEYPRGQVEQALLHLGFQRSVRAEQLSVDELTGLCRRLKR